MQFIEEYEGLIKECMKRIRKMLMGDLKESDLLQCTNVGDDHK